MNTSARPEVPRQTDHVQERGGNPDEGAFETFVGGAGS
jgi:hypothetical protein